MKIIQPSVEIFKDKTGEQILKNIERAGRVCYKSEDKITQCSAESFVRTLIYRNHFAVIEHESVTVKIICDRGVSHELVRHRLASYCQESTRYCNYGKKNIEFIVPSVFDDVNTPQFNIWLSHMTSSEEAYKNMLNGGSSPQTARSVLPNSLKTEVIMTANLREWRHFFTLRCDNAAHPDMKRVALMLLKEMSEYIPAVFDDIKKKFII